MKTLLSGLLATTLAATFAIVTIAPLSAAPLPIPRSEAAQTDVQTVQDSQDWRRMKRRIDRNDDRFQRRDERRPREFQRDADNRYHNGHRGYRDYHRGYRRHNGLWFPAAAFITGAIISGAINNDNADSGRNAHVEWCYDRYRSYRASSNTYKPNGAPRRQCNSPYN